METIANILLIVHVASGMTCLGAGIMAIATKKGGKLHAISGKSYFIAMFTVIGTALALAFFRYNLFLLLIASFSFYMTWAGVRSVHNKSLKASVLDWIFLGTAIVTAASMILTFNIVLIVFGSLLTVNIIQETTTFFQARKAQLEKTNKWLIRHIGMMLGSFIATTTAFLVTNVQDFDPAWLPWLAPTIVGSPLIAYYTRKTIKNGI
ncbi:MAG: hypothetical protein DCO96_12190 [Fluviicola sp. XM-24bin1]|nr:MAG: hypothetical protein DCO96_12190 [Fluviicola sp. XM-24bin1]